ncbi:MAG: nucleotidyltransferase domain-containing protein [Syntrophales bacterium]|nr:nucleotidyltransferase domain-containing protein [Syntrophales bacterium]
MNANFKDLTPILGELKRRLVEVAGPQLVRMVLYGSRARGDDDANSDTDIAVIVRDLTPQMKRRLWDAVADVELTYLCPLSTLILSEADFQHLKNHRRRIALDIEREGLPL